MTDTFAWMGWTWQTGAFFAAVGTLLLLMIVWQQVSPTVERNGMLGIATTRGDRLFISLLGSAFINLGWLALIGPSLWWAVLVSFLFALAVFRWV